MKYPIHIRESKSQPHIYHVFGNDGVQWGDICSTDQDGVNQLVALVNGGEQLLRALAQDGMDAALDKLAEADRATLAVRTGQLQESRRALAAAEVRAEKAEAALVATTGGDWEEDAAAAFRAFFLAKSARATSVTDFGYWVNGAQWQLRREGERMKLIASLEAERDTLREEIASYQVNAENLEIVRAERDTLRKRLAEAEERAEKAEEREQDKESRALLNDILRACDAGDPQGSFWEDRVTGERIWKPLIDSHLHARIIRAYLGGPGGPGGGPACDLAGTVETPPPAQAQEEHRAKPTTVDEQLAHPANFLDRFGDLYLARCMACGGEHGRENYGPAIASGTCAWCGWTEEDGHEEQDRRDDDDWMGDWNN